MCRQPPDLYLFKKKVYIREKGFGPRETQVALGNFYFLKEYLALWVAPDVFGCLWVSLGVFGSLWKSLEVFGCL